MEKYISGIDELNLGERVSGGNCSNIFYYAPGIYFKEFNEDYRDLNEDINIEFLKTIKYLSDIANIPSIVRAINIYRSKLELFGYTMFSVDAKNLEDISDDVLLKDVVSSFEGLEPEIRILSDSYVKTEDIGGDNILYNGRLYLLDLDLSLVDKRYNPDELYSRTTYSVFKSLLLRMIGKLSFDGLENFRAKLKAGENNEYSIYFRELINRCSNEVGYEVKTLGEVKKVYQKIYGSINR